MKTSAVSSTDLLALEPVLVSERTGIVRNFRPVQKDIMEPLQPYIFRAELSNHSFIEDSKLENRLCSGKGFTVGDAKISALGEAVERYSGACLNYDKIVYARRSELNGASLHPDQLVLYAPDQYPNLPYAPYNDENTLGWVQARSLVTGKMIYVPAIGAYMDYQIQVATEFLFPITSNGLAAGPTLIDAVVSAALEVIERDAFMLTWLNQLPATRVNWENHPEQDVRHLCLAYRRRGVEMHVYRLLVDHPCHVFAAIATQVQDGEPKIVVGLGADLLAHRAARKAIVEVAQVRPGLRQRCRLPEYRQRMEELLADPHQVKELEDHDLLYAHPKAISPVEFLLCQPITEYEWDASKTLTASEKIQLLIDDFAPKSQDLLYVNLTPPDMEALGLHTARVIIPGFQPIDFGWNERRLGGDRLYNISARLGLAPQRTTREQINDAPHPIA